MLGTYTRGMTIKIPARFMGDGKPVTVENVVVRIEHWDNYENRVMHDLPSTPMRQISPSDYIYEYEVPQALKEGSYIVHISAKVPQNGGKVFEAIEQFDIVHSGVAPISTESSPAMENMASVEELRLPPKINNSIDYFSNNVDYSNGQDKLIEDIVVDIENKPIKGIHVNAFMKRDFRPNSQDNVKVGSSLTDEEGRWKMKLPVGEYAFSYKGIGFKEYREFRKV